MLALAATALLRRRPRKAALPPLTEPTTERVDVPSGDVTVLPPRRPRPRGARAGPRKPGAGRRAAGPAALPAGRPSDRWAGACSACSPGTGSTRRPGRRSRRPCSPPTSAWGRPRSWSTGCATGLKAPAPSRPRAAARGAGGPGRPGPRPVAATRDRRPAGGRPGRRGQRDRQDHLGGQAGPGAGGRRPQRPARGGRHLPGRGRRPAADLGRAGRRTGGPRARGR